jgi:Aminoglycoside/hydroxyurea antibiotic resistance kinase
LKGTNEPEELTGAGLEEWAGRGAVLVLAPHHNATALERAEGTLRSLVTDDAAAIRIPAQWSDDSTPVPPRTWLTFLTGSKRGFVLRRTGRRPGFLATGNSGLLVFHRE